MLARCTLFFPATLKAPTAQTPEVFRELWTRGVRVYSVHGGGPCKDPQCPFARAQLPPRESFAASVVDEREDEADRYHCNNVPPETP